LLLEHDRVVKGLAVILSNILVLSLVIRDPSCRVASLLIDYLGLILRVWFLIYIMEGSCIRLA
jgi:hypothetical protein